MVLEFYRTNVASRQANIGNVEFSKQCKMLIENEVFANPKRTSQLTSICPFHDRNKTLALGSESLTETSHDRPPELGNRFCS